MDVAFMLGFSGQSTFQRYICEDAECRCLLHQLDPDDTRTPVARSVTSEDELCGVCTSPDGSVVFVNLQRSGVTIAILGLPA
ncbi:MAG: hypothetical protein KTR31_29675 [Myxococcales bacterium]|nr:hypothetical protein [Myxococcales bacterium]